MCWWFIGIFNQTISIAMFNCIRPFTFASVCVSGSLSYVYIEANRTNSHKLCDVSYQYKLSSKYSRNLAGVR